MKNTLPLALLISFIPLLVQSQKVIELKSPPRVKIIALDKDEFKYIPPPSRMKSTKSATFDVKYDGFSDEAKVAFQAAVDIWASLINSSQTIIIDAKWEALEEGTLGSCGPSTFYAAATLPHKQTFYPIGLANKLDKKDFNTSLSDLSASFNSDNPNWYYGTDGQTPSGKYDLMSVVLHEIGHGLGIIGSISYNAGVGSWGIGNNVTYPAIMDLFIVNGEDKLLIDPNNFPNNSTQLGSQVTSNNIYFSGEAAKNMSQSNEVKLYAPSSFRDGSSIYHLDEIFNNTPNDLMTYSIPSATAIHDPGPIALGILADMGWVVTNLDVENKLSTETPTSTVDIIAQLEKDVDVNNFKLIYSTDTFKSELNVDFVVTAEQGKYKASITGITNNTHISYYATVTDSLKRTYVSPSTAPTKFYDFFIGTDIVAPEITHTATEKLFFNSEKLDLNFDVSDNIGLDTINIVVEYSINKGNFINANSKFEEGIFKSSIPLSNTSLSKGDSIRYRIKATDKAANPNTAYLPKSGYFKVDIVSSNAAVNDYTNNFDGDVSDFILEKFTISQPSGFNSKGLHSSHPYESKEAKDTEVNHIAQMTTPIILASSDAKLQFEEIVLVEPGESTTFGSDNFFDYVVIEGSKDDGTTWSAIEDGYDSRANSAWESIFDGGEGSPSLYKTRTIDLLSSSNFSVGDEVLIRFRLYSDPFSTGWGWAIDNLRIQKDITQSTKSITGIYDFNIYPNPSNGTIYIKADFESNINGAQIDIYNVNGSLVLSKKYSELSKYFFDEIELPEQSKGLHFIKFSSPKGSYSEKIIIL